MSLKKLFIVRFGIQFLLVVVLMILTLLLFKNQRDLFKSQDVHFKSYLLADELRQSSDDLTRMARAYVVTGNAEFEREYWSILDIRNGKSLRPVDYNRIYWDFMPATGEKPRPDGEAISLHDLMVNAGFTQTEFDKLALAQRNSDGLVSTEKIAMNAVKGLFDDGSGNFTVKKKPDREMAIRIMFGEAYYKTKAEIMKPIDDFYLMFEKRTDADISKYENRSTNFLRGIITIIALILGMFLLSFVAIKRQLTAREHAEEDLIIANKELVFQNEEKEKRADELTIANKELAYQISERKQAEEVLSNERTLLRTLLDLLPSFVFVKDHKMRFLVANVACARYMGASSPQELIGKTDAEFYPPEAAAGFMSDELGVMEGIPVVNKEEARILSNGTRQIILTTKVPFRNNDGNIIGLVGASLDITELKRADEKLKNKIDELAIANKKLAFQNKEKEKRADELEIKVEERTKQLTEINKKLVEAKSEAEQANQAKSEFLANMSHEIRTPMNAILGYTELLSSTIIDQTQKDYINSIKSSGRSLLTLINDILDLSKIEAGKLEMELDYVDTYSFFSEFERMFSLKVTEKGLKFILDITSGTPQGVYIDEARVRQIVFNLIGNAIKFTSEGKITLKIYTENPQIVNYSKGKTKELINLIIEVEDTGIGISKELQEAIFEPFVQERDYKHYGGTGLGLAITRRLTALMNGNINVRSELGKGSTFTVRIPELPYLRDFSKATVDIQIDPSEIVFEKAVILIADDVQHNRSYLTDALKNTNLEIVEAEDGLEAYKLAKEIVPNLIIADIKMPKMDGFQLLKKLKTDKKLKHIPAIAYSASVLKGQKERIHKSEFAGLLIKPVKVAELYIELMNFLPFKSTRKAESDKPHSEVDLFGGITDLPGLIQSLETSFYATWKTFAVTQSIREIREFGKNLSQLGLEHNSNIITGYGKDLISAADSFNIEAILKLIGKYKVIIESFKDSTKNISND